MSLVTKIFGDANEKYLKKVQPLVEKINSLEKQFQGFSNEELKQKTEELKRGLKNLPRPAAGGAGRENSLDDILPQAFALVRESAKRTLNQRHFDVQLIGGIVLHQGKIAEMKTGEGKTLAATLPAFLNALAGKGVHIITVNDYLAKRDTVWMGQIYHFLGLSVGCIVHDAAFLYDPEYSGKRQAASGKEIDTQRDQERDIIGGFKIIESYLRPCSRKEAYSADIIYGTNNEFGFDYLRDNMVYDPNQMVQAREREAKNIHNYVIIDEVDSILIDEARTPLIISAPDSESSKWYQDFAKIIPRLNSEGDYEIDEKARAVSLTEKGINKIEKILKVENIYQEKGIKYLHHLEQALRAESLFKKDRDYVIKEGEVIIIDEFTGRLMPGRRWSGGLHQAVEAKEGVLVQPESMTLATISFQNYFRKYKKIAGMTGTAATSAEEFHKVYGLDVVIVPTNKPMIRRNLTDRIYKNNNGKLKAVVEEIKSRYEKGQPILVGTRSVEKNEYLGRLLDKEGVAHQILNAKNHQGEGEIIAQAGRLGQVTVATNMAGRGVDIILGGNPPDSVEAEKIKDLGGLHVIGTERHEARRIDDQLRGRAGRQGDPGSSQFFVSLEDDLMRIFGGDKVKSIMETLRVPEEQPMEAKIISGVIEKAQANIEGMNFDVRKHLLDYDDVMSRHRETFYKKRREVLERIETGRLREYILEIVKGAGFSEKDYEKKEKELGSENMRQLEKIACLRVLDSLWIEHLENMEYLRDSVRLRAYGQKDPLVEYKKEGHQMFQRFLATFETAIVQAIFRAKLAPAPFPPPPAAGRGTQVRKKPGRNDPCPCGAKKPDGRPIKYKHCHGK